MTNQEDKKDFGMADVCAPDLIRAYWLYHEMIRYPHLLGEIRKLFLSALCEKGIVCRDTIRQDAIAQLEALGEQANERTVLEFVDVLTDVFFARNFEWEDVENYINLARKRDAFQNLNRILNLEGVTWIRIRDAVREFCAIPQGSLYISPDEAMGVRVALVSRFIS